jgi:hypothetical protein
MSRISWKTWIGRCALERADIAENGKFSPPEQNAERFWRSLSAFVKPDSVFYFFANSRNETWFAKGVAAVRDRSAVSAISAVKKISRHGVAIIEEAPKL